MQLVHGPYQWIADLGISYHVGVDGIALLLVLLLLPEMVLPNAPLVPRPLHGRGGGAVRRRST